MSRKARDTILSGAHNCIASSDFVLMKTLKFLLLLSD